MGPYDGIGGGGAGAATSMGGGGMNPYIMGAGAALDTLGGLADQQLKGRQFKLDKAAQFQNATDSYLDRINAQKRRQGQTGTNSALLSLMAQKLGLGPDFQFGRAQELQIKPVSGQKGAADNFQRFYGYDKNMSPGAPPPSPLPVRPSAPQKPTLQALLAQLMGGGR